MIDTPIIVKFESQKAINHYSAGDGYVVVIENIGIDKHGGRWRFYSNTTYRDGLAYGGSLYGFAPLLKA